MYRVNNAVLLLTFLATHMGSAGLVLYGYCQKKCIPWNHTPHR